MEFSELINKIGIQSPVYGFLTSNKLTISQNELLRFIDKNKFSIIYKRRQEGVSTAISMYMLWLLINNPGYSIGMLFKNNSEKENFRQLINMNLTTLEGVFKKLGIDMVLTPERHNQSFTLFPNKSRINYWSRRSENAFRGHGINFAYISEITQEENYMQIIQGIWPCVAHSQKGKFLITTTDLRNLKEDFHMNGDGISEYWCSDFFDGKRFVIVEKYRYYKV